MGPDLVVLQSNKGDFKEVQLQCGWYILLRQRIQSVRVCRLAGEDGRVALSSDTDTGANLGQSAGSRAIEARAAIATAQLRSISSSVGSTSSHGERIVAAIDGLIDDVMPELEAAEALTGGSKSGRSNGSAAVRPPVWVHTRSAAGALS